MTLLSKSSPPRCVSPLVEITSKTPLSMVKTETSKVEPDQSLDIKSNSNTKSETETPVKPEESKLEKELTIDVVNLLMNLYQKAVEYFSAFNDPAFEDYVDKLHYLLSREDVQVVLQSREEVDNKGEPRKISRPEDDEEEEKKEAPSHAKGSYRDELKESPIKTPEKFKFFESPLEKPQNNIQPQEETKESQPPTQEEVVVEKKLEPELTQASEIKPSESEEKPKEIEQTQEQKVEILPTQPEDNKQETTENITKEEVLAPIVEKQPEENKQEQNQVQLETENKQETIENTTQEEVPAPIVEKQPEENKQEQNQVQHETENKQEILSENQEIKEEPKEEPKNEIKEESKQEEGNR